MHTKFWSENLEGRDHLENVDTYGRLILIWILGSRVGNCWWWGSDYEWLLFGYSPCNAVAL